MLDSIHFQSTVDNCGAELYILGVSVPDKRIKEHVDGVGASKCSVRMCGGLGKKGVMGLRQGVEDRAVDPDHGTG
jgi:hypothetical protein